ncbi:MAG: Septum formation initiator [Actinomycetia bacterium]|nr:Septum formation initiator [Actinomycetes bacterium]
MTPRSTRARPRSRGSRPPDRRLTAVPRVEKTNAAQAAAIAAASRSTRLTGRAALLAVVICAIALSLAYPVREYLAQRQQVDQLLAQRQTTSAQVAALQQEVAKLGRTSYIEQQAQDQLHMCFPDENCYEVITGSSPAASPLLKPPANPWYAKLWQSVQRAGQETPKL